MRQFPIGDPPPPGLSGTLENRFQCLQNAGPYGGAAGPLSLNPIGQMPLYAASLANLDMLGASNLGAQNRQPMRLSPPPASLSLSLESADVSLSSAACDCGPAAGGSGIGATGPGGNVNSMTTCDLNPALCVGPDNPNGFGSPPCKSCMCIIGSSSSSPSSPSNPSGGPSFERI